MPGAAEAPATPSHRPRRGQRPGLRPCPAEKDPPVRSRGASPPLCGCIKLLDYLCIYFDGICVKTICLNIYTHTYVYIYIINVSIPNKLPDLFSFLPAGVVQ